MRETGIGIPNPLFFIGVVENNVDERLEGRVQVRAFGVHGTNKQVPTESLPWATLIHGSYDADAPLPPVNSFVFGFFIDGRDAQQPMILGLIPTQLLEPINPELSGWGSIPRRDSDLLARGSTPNDIGQPRNSREARGENIESTYVLQQEVNRRLDIPIAGINPDAEDDRTTFSEPAPAYGTEYPFNRVIRSGRNIIELDDTPGAERIMIYHTVSGSYISIDTRGTSVYRSMSDTYDINERNHNVFIGGCSNVTIMGDSRVLVMGNKVEEITGDLIQSVRGNHLLSVGGQSNINVGEDIQMRAAKIRIEANVENVNIKAARDVKIEAGEFIQMKSGATTNMEAADAININATDGNINMQSGADFNLKAAAAYITAEGALDLFGGHVKAGGGTKVSVNASIVAIDDIIQLANGSSTPPVEAGDAGTAEGAEATEMPEPVSRGASVSAGTCEPNLGGVGYASSDDPNDVSGDDEQSENETDAGAETEDLSRPGNNPSINDPEVQARLQELRNDPEFMREFNATLERFPGLTADQLWGTIAGESEGDPSLINTDSNSQYGGLFQLGQVSVGLSPQEVARRSPSEQMRLYRGYLESSNYIPGQRLGMYQAAPGVVQNYASRNNGAAPPDNLLLYIPRQYNAQQIQALQEAGYITDYASREFGNVVLEQNSGGRADVITPGTGWVETVSPELQRLGIPGVITAGQVNSFYEDR